MNDPMKPIVFRAVSGIIVQVTDHRRFSIMPVFDVSAPLTFDPRHFIRIDLDRSPRGPGSWADVEIDDRGTDVKGNFLSARVSDRAYHVTSLGNVGNDLVRGRQVGVAYLAPDAFKAANIGSWPPPGSGFLPYELMTIAYPPNVDGEPRAGKRYAGFQARFYKDSKPNGSFGLVEILRPQVALAPPWGPFWIDLASAGDCDASPPDDAGGTALSLATTAGQVAPLFLELGRVAAFEVSNPKLPIGQGA